MWAAAQGRALPGSDCRRTTQLIMLARQAALHNQLCQSNQLCQRSWRSKCSQPLYSPLWWLEMKSTSGSFSNTACVPLPLHIWVGMGRAAERTVQPPG